MDHHFLIHAVYAKGHRSNNYLCALADQVINIFINHFLRQHLFLNEGIKYLDHSANFFIQYNILQSQLTLCKKSFQTASRYANYTYICHVALNKSIGSLSSRMGYEHYIFRCNVIFPHTILKTLNNTGSNAVLVIVGCLYFIFSNNFVGFIVHCYAFCVGSTYVNTHADSSVLTFCHTSHILSI